MNPPLKPCPFCGDVEAAILQYIRDIFAVRCPSCWADGPVKDTAEEAAAAWNTRGDRADPEPQLTVPALTVHGLQGGFALCFFNKSVPGHWPEGHVWVDPRTDAHEITCRKCLDYMKDHPLT